MKPIAVKKSVAACLSLCALSLAAHAGQVEVLHWWTSGGEAKSVAELKKIMETKGDKWQDFAVAGGGGENAMTVLKSRVVSGNAPTAAQIKGPSIQEWAAEGVTANLNDVAKAGQWDSLLPAVVSNAMKYKGNYVAVPVNVHRVNWMWVNPEVFKKAGATVPKTWDEVPAAAEKLQKAGVTPVAHGGQPWQDFTVFESIVLGVGGADFYDKALVKLDQNSLKSPTMEKAFTTLRTVRKYVDKDFANRDWNLATAMVINGKAGMQFMGDWAKGEFENAGKKSGKDYICAPVPGTSNAYTFNVDSFVFFQQKGSENATPGQLALAKTIMTPDFQEQFSLLKGSIPVRLGVKMDKFDDCAKKSYADEQTALKAGGYVPSLAHGMAQGDATAGAISDVVTKFMNSQQDPKEAVAALVKAAKVK